MARNLNTLSLLNLLHYLLLLCLSTHLYTTSCIPPGPIHDCVSRFMKSFRWGHFFSYRLIHLHHICIYIVVGRAHALKRKLYLQFFGNCSKNNARIKRRWMLCHHEPIIYEDRARLCKQRVEVNYNERRWWRTRTEPNETHALSWNILCMFFFFSFKWV